MPASGWHLWYCSSWENLLTFYRGLWGRNTFKFYKMVNSPLVLLKSISRGQINKSTLKLEMSRIPQTGAEKKKMREGIWVWGWKSSQHNLTLILLLGWAWGILDKVKGNCKIRPGNLHREAQHKPLGLREAEKVWGIVGEKDLGRLTSCGGIQG